MPAAHPDIRTLDPQSPPQISDDECISLLARAVDAHDADKLDEVTWLIARLAAPIEWAG